MTQLGRPQGRPILRKKVMTISKQVTTRPIRRALDDRSKLIEQMSLIRDEMRQVEYDVMKRLIASNRTDLFSIKWEKVARAEMRGEFK